MARRSPKNKSRDASAQRDEKPIRPASAPREPVVDAPSAPTPAAPSSPSAASSPELAPVSWAIVAAILAGFAILSLAVAALSWKGFQVSRHTLAAEKAIADKRYVAAISHLQYIVDKFPKAYVRYTQLGDCFLELERAEDALLAYQKSLEAEADYRKTAPQEKVAKPQDLRARIGRAQYLLGRYDEGGKLLEKALKDDPNDPEANYYIGLILVKQKQYARAAACFQAASARAEFREKAKPALSEIRAALLGS